jgi:hypothetical protein
MRCSVAYMKQISRSKVKDTLGVQRQTLFHGETSTNIEGLLHNLAQIFKIVRQIVVRKIQVSLPAEV